MVSGLKSKIRKMSRKSRSAEYKRKTAETVISGRLDLDGQGVGHVKTGMPFLDHMLMVMSKHGFFSLSLRAQGDLEVDFHHTVEDLGIVLGELLRRVLVEKGGIRRFGHAAVPMDETLAIVTLDLSGRSHLVYHVEVLRRQKIRDFDVTLVEHFFEALVNHSGMTLHINVSYGKNPHHILEAIFKAFGKALDQATQFDERLNGVLSTKGEL
jgi:imidazoleglycerol-phosphate dehydratase